MIVLITGGCGFIGSHICECLIEAGFEVSVVDDLSSGKYKISSPFIHYYEGEITSEKMKMIFQDVKPDYVIHLAAQIDVNKSMDDPVFDAKINIFGTIQILQLCRTHFIKRFIFPSTSAVYGDLGTRTADESSPLQPISFYGLSKLASEMYIKQFCQQFHLPYTIFRYSNVYGPRQSSRNEGGVIPVFIKDLKEGKSPTIFGDGLQTRDFIHVKDVARANLLAIERDVNSIINISSNTSNTINQLYSFISKDFRDPPKPNYAGRRNGDILFSKLDNKKAFECLGWKPQISLEEGIREML